jgi:hypothetical protein
MHCIEAVSLGGDFQWSSLEYVKLYVCVCVCVYIKGKVAPVLN